MFPLLSAVRVLSQELMDIVFDQKFPVVGEELPVTMGFENIIFVMEDVDAASPIVQSRDRSKRKKKRGTKTTVKVLKCSRTYVDACQHPPLATGLPLHPV